MKSAYYKKKVELLETEQNDLQKQHNIQNWKKNPCKKEKKKMESMHRFI